MAGSEPAAAGPESPGAAAPAIEAPRGGGAVRGIGEKFGTNPVTGTASMTVPIATSPGRSGFGPQLVLGYDSGSGNGPFGFGWSLDLPAITRKTDKGLPRYDDDQDVFILSAAEDLVPCGRGDGGPAYAVRRYRPRIEGLFARIERWTHRATGEVHWRSISRDNITTRYGTSPNSRIADPDDPRRVFSWLISESHDGRGNATVYEYAEEDGHGVDLARPSERTRTRTANRYPRVIRYGNDRPNRDPLTWEPTDPRDLDTWRFEVVFDYDEGLCRELPLDPGRAPDEQHTHVEVRPAPADPGWAARPDPFSAYRAGFEVRTHRRCRRVLMFHRFDELGEQPCLVRSTEFEYADLDYSFLRSVAQAGYVRAEGQRYLRRELPPVEFEYSRAAVDPTVRELDAESLRNLPAGIDGAAYEWVDLDGEGAPGVLARSATGAAFYKPSLGGGRFGPAAQLPAQPAAGVGTLLDLAGDGRLDAVVLDGPAPGFHERTGDGTWTAFRPFRSLPPLDWGGSDVRLVDLTGDGLADVLVDGDGGLRWHPSLGEDGFGPQSRTYPAWGEDDGPRLVLADREQSVYLADMTGDGLADVVRVRNGEVCYWPSLGYGRFGAKVVMEDAPRLDGPDAFEQRRVLLADVDGTGTTDIVYLGADGPVIHANRSGNAWDKPVALRGFPRLDQTASVTIADLFGDGTACLVWSSALPGERQRPVRYVDLMGGQKPHLLVRTVNNQGAETTVGYATSTRFSLADRAAGRPWASSVPFPVHVVERTETRDRVGGTRLVTRFAYHDGYFDGVEREFRGFGLVERWDAEEFGGTAIDPPSNEDPAFHVPPALTRTWFHTGRPGAPGGTVPAGLTVEEEREAYRALKGSMLRQEVYALDGGPLQDRPYTVTEQEYTVRLVQPRGGNRHAVFFRHGRESVARHFERRAGDPRVRHELTLDVDEYGTVLRYAGIAYGRSTPDPALHADEQAVQARDLITFTENDVTNAVDGPGGYRTPQQSASRTYELTGVARPHGALLTAAEVRAALNTAATRGYRQPPTPGRVERRLIEHLRTRYRRDDLAGPLPAGELQPLALPFDSYRLAFPDGLVEDAYQGRVTEAMLRDEGRYVHEDGGWWVPSGQVSYSASEDDDELAQARAHFFLPRRYRSPFGTESVASYDHDLLVSETVDALGNRTAAEQDWRVLQPAVVTDANGNRTAVAFDALGLVVGTATIGSGGEGDRLTGAFSLDLTQAQVEAYFADPRGPLAAELLGEAGARMVHDLRAPSRGEPMAVATIARETHAADLAPGQASALRVSVSYADGLGREIQKKVQAEHGRWVGTGWTVLNNKGKPVRKFEPFFAGSHRFERDARAGVSAILCYDPLARVVATLHPDHTWEKVDLDPWGQRTWDTADTVLVADPRTDPTVGGWFRRLPEQEFLPTWHARRAGGDLGRRERIAAGKAARYAGTPATAYTDPLGRAFLTVTTDGATELRTRTVLDVEGNQREVIDPLGRTVIRYEYSVLGSRIHQASMESGERWTLGDAGGDVLYAWDSRGHRVRTSYDELRRPAGLHLSVDGGPEQLVGRSVYGESLPDAADRNLRTRLALVHDQAGVASYDEYDFKGNLTRSGRRLAEPYDRVLDWSGEVPLGAAYSATTRFDALNRVAELTEPDGTVIRPAYNEANLLERVEAVLAGEDAATEFVAGIEYDARGRRTEIRYGNGVRTTYAYDPDTFRLVRTVTVGPKGLLQDQRYTYDPVGNVTTLRDRARRAVFFRGRRVDADRDYTYDALYRLVEATGREHPGQGPYDESDSWAVTRLHAQDGQALARYRERYAYDPAGNITSVEHRGADPAHPGWTRTFAYDEPSQLDPAHRSNRLTSATVGGRAEVFSHGGDGYDPHGGMLRLPHLSDVEWDYRGQLRRTARQVVTGGGGERTWYVYDAAGQRVRKVTVRPDGRIRDERVYFGGFEELRRHGAKPVTRQTLHVMDDNRRIALVETRVAGRDRGPRRLVRFQFADALGSVNLEVDGRARVITYEEYAPYGSTTLQAARRRTAESAPKRYRYTGMERDEESGFAYHGARYYAPWLCRWTSCDPAGLADGPNVYAYVSGRPTRASDPTGTQGSDANEIMMGMMWDQMGREFSAMIEGVFGGRAYVNPRANTVDYSGPTGGVGGMVGGVVRAATLRIVPIEDRPSGASLVGMEMGAGFVIVLDPGTRLVTGTTVTGQDTSRGWAAVQFGLDVLPFAIELRAATIEARLASTETRLLTVDARAAAAESELLDLTHIGSNNTGTRRPTVTNPTCRGDLCVADVGAHEANLRNPGQQPITNTEFVAASGQEVNWLEAPISNTGEAISFLNKGYAGLEEAGRIGQPIRASIPMEPTLQPGNYLAVVDGPMGEHALHATVTDEMIGRRFISEGRLVTEAEALEIVDNGGRVVDQPIYRTEYYDPQNGVCVQPTSRPRSFVRLE